VPIHSPLYHSPVGAHLGALKGKFARTCAAVGALADTKSAHALMRSCLGPAKVQYASHNLPIRHTAAFAADVTTTQRATWDAVVCTPTSDAAWVQTTLPLSNGGFGFASASDVAPLARLAGVMQFLARAEPLLGCDRILSCPWPPRRDCCMPPMPACPRPGTVCELDADWEVGTARWGRATSALAVRAPDPGEGGGASRGGHGSRRATHRGTASGEGGWLAFGPPWQAKVSAWPAPTTPHC